MFASSYTVIDFNAGLHGREPRRLISLCNKKFPILSNVTAPILLSKEMCYIIFSILIISFYKSIDRFTIKFCRLCTFQKILVVNSRSQYKMMIKR